jgi:RNA polymerase-binding transcription factor DksA
MPAPRARAAATRAHRLASPVLLAPDMTHQKLERVRRALLRRRDDLMARQRIASRDEQELVAEREPDWPDAAALDSAATILERLGVSERASIRRIDAALERIERGTYGACAECGESIDDLRLRALPEADRCGLCARAAA